MIPVDSNSTTTTQQTNNTTITTEVYEYRVYWNIPLTKHTHTHTSLSYIRVVYEYILAQQPHKSKKREMFRGGPLLFALAAQRPRTHKYKQNKQQKTRGRRRGVVEDVTRAPPRTQQQHTNNNKADKIMWGEE